MLAETDVIPSVGFSNVWSSVKISVIVGFEPNDATVRFISDIKFLSNTWRLGNSDRVKLNGPVKLAKFFVAAS